MIVSEPPNRVKSRTLQACFLLCAVVVLPIGLTYAQDVEAVGARLKAAGEKIRAAGQAGKFDSAEEAVAKWHKIKEEIIQEALAEGEISSEQADSLRIEIVKAEAAERAKWAGLESIGARLKAAGERIRAAGEAGKFDSAEEAVAKWHKIKEEIIQEALAEGEISSEQADILRLEIVKAEATEQAEGLVGHYKRMGVAVDTLGRFKKALAAEGVKDTQMEGTLGGLLRVVHEMKSEGDDYELDLGLGKYFRDDVGLTSKQIEVVEGIARRVLYGMQEGKRDKGLVGHYKRMGVAVDTLGRFKKALAAEGVKDTQMEGTLGGLLRVVHEMKSEGDDYELDVHLEDYFEGELGLTDRHIELVEGIARRIVHGMTESDRER